MPKISLNSHLLLHRLLHSGVGSLIPYDLELVEGLLPVLVRRLVPVELLLEVLIAALSARELPPMLIRRRPKTALADDVAINANVEVGDRLTADQARLRSTHELVGAVSANHGVAAGANLSVRDVVEADNAIIFVLVLIGRGFERNGRRGRKGRRDFLLKSDADFLVERPVGFLMLLGAVPSLLATGTGLRGVNGAGGKGAVGSGFGECSGFGRGLARFHFWGDLVYVEGIEVRLVG